MRHTRELWWWLAACAAGVGLSAWAGGLIGPMVALFVVVVLAGALLIEFEGTPAVAADYGEDADVGADPAHTESADLSQAATEVTVADEKPVVEPESSPASKAEIAEITETAEALGGRESTPSEDPAQATAASV